ncbi:hypothetical protein CLCR_00825 [Cladophialophora carrionii]|uniref:DNA ligase D 3'-phosphoesterase domain-containing protein n=1 Tax=Cladophialophora carrionii TaxID=86049 RepID=A0A1C1D0V7_9EURO|nr:hypothetical protein CLCR_00825 [Cladophialophora carrionii]
MKEQTPDTPREHSPIKPESKSGVARVSSPASLKRDVSPPPINRRRLHHRKSKTHSRLSTNSATKSDTAQVEAGEVDIEDHVSFFSSKLLAATRPPVEGQPRLSHSNWLALYRGNLHDRGHHFVVHQHDHPIAGTHYDLRLQCNATSSISFALPYGLPGDPNSRRLNRYAIETRVHNLWNHLIETASYETGTMLLWDTGEYEVIPYDTSYKNASTVEATATEGSDSDTDSELVARREAESEPQKLHRAFRNRKIKLRLNGTRLPKDYTISVRLLEDNNRIGQPDAPAFKRRRTTIISSTPSKPAVRRNSQVQEIETSSDSSRPYSPSAEAESDEASLHSGAPSPTGTSFDSLENSLTRKRPPKLKRNVSSLLRTASPPPPKRGSSIAHVPRTKFAQSWNSTGSHATAHPQSQFEVSRPTLSTHTRSKTLPSSMPHLPSPSAESPSQRQPDNLTTEATEDMTIRQSNAYPGATNTINSIHQRKWFLSLDRAACGFRPTNEFAFGRRVWERPRLTGTDTSGEPKSDVGGFKPFYVRGREVETSVLTGRLAADVARDEGLVGYKPRGGWKGITD